MSNSMRTINSQRHINTLPEKRTHENGKGDVYTLDSVYRLISAKINVVDPLAEIQYPGSQQYDKKIDYNLDGVGNRETMVITPWNEQSDTVTYTTNNLNQYTQIRGTNLTYDNNGNLKDDGIYLYYYDYANRLVEIRLKSDNSIVASFKTDALGRRISKTNNQQQTTNYVLDKDRVIEEYNENNTLLAIYTFGNGIDEVLQMSVPTSNIQHPIAGTFYYHENTLGSIYAVTNETGNVVERYAYDPYGKVTIYDSSNIQIPTSNIGNRFMFTGREYDKETGLYYYRARYYSPEMGRFLQRDPIGYLGGVNLYSYCDNNPVNYVDPYGESFWSAIKSAASAVGSVVKKAIETVKKVVKAGEQAREKVRESIIKNLGATKELVKAAVTGDDIIIGASRDSLADQVSYNPTAKKSVQAVSVVALAAGMGWVTGHLIAAAGTIIVFKIALAFGGEMVGDPHPERIFEPTPIESPLKPGDIEELPKIPTSEGGE